MKFIKLKKCQIQFILDFLNTYPNVNPSIYKINRSNINSFTFEEFIQIWLKYINISPNIIPFYMDKVINNPINHSVDFLTLYEKDVINSNCGCIVLCGLKSSRKYRMNMYLDKKTYGYTYQTWGNSRVESILQYTQHRNLPIFHMISQLSVKIYKNE